jgi:hypothetical protein
MAHLTGIVVDVVPSAGPQAPTWSGLEADSPTGTPEPAGRRSGPAPDGPVTTPTASRGG